MIFNLNELAVALSHALDFMEIDFLGGVTYHSKRVAYIASRLAEKLGLSSQADFDVVTLSILHDNGIGAAVQWSSSGLLASGMDRHGDLSKVDSGAFHCVAGEENVRGYPFLTDVSNVLKYHHENWDGSGFFHVSAADIPLLARIIRLADVVELHSRLDGIDFSGKRDLEEWTATRRGRLFSPEVVDAFLQTIHSPAFWMDLRSEFIDSALAKRVPRFERELSFQGIREVTSIFSRIIDSKSRFTSQHSQELSERVGRMAGHYGMDETATSKLRIAADLHDVGKLAVSNAILEKPGKLDPPETDVIQRHTYYTRISLQSISGFEDITEWAANHHEKLDGSGYPFGLAAEALDFNSRMMACLDIYQALTELRPYREALSHDRALGIMREMVRYGKLDGAVVEDIDGVFAQA